jgi:hypothetical protein
MAIATTENVTTNESKPWLDDQGNLICDCCLMVLNPLTPDDELERRWELHGDLLAIERRQALDVLELMARVIEGDSPMDCDKIDIFAGPHQWMDQTTVYRILRQVGDIAQLYHRARP